MAVDDGMMCGVQIAGTFNSPLCFFIVSRTSPDVWIEISSLEGTETFGFWGRAVRVVRRSAKQLWIRTGEGNTHFLGAFGLNDLAIGQMADRY